MPSNSQSKPKSVHEVLTVEEQLVQSRAAWVPPGATVEVRGRVITNGMLYTGEQLAGLHRSQPVEPVFVNPRLKAAPPEREPSYSFHASYKGYAGLSPAHRGRYLDWLAAGRPPAGAIDHSHLFLMGLERRILFDARHDDTARDELPFIIEAIQQIFLALAVEQSWDIVMRFSNLPLIAMAMLPDFDPSLLEAPIDPYTWLPSFPLQLGLGAFVTQDRPLSAEWAYAWVMSSRESSVPSVRYRCPADHDPLFERAYQMEFGDGLRISADPSAPTLGYRPVNPTFGAPVPVGRLPLPLVGPPGPQYARLRSLVASVSALLEDFVAHIPWNADGPMLTTYAYYPEAGLPLEQVPAAAEFAAGLAETMAEDGIVLLQKSGFMTMFPEISNPITPNQASALSLLLERIGYGIEPDPVTLKAAFSRASSIAIYRIEHGPDPYYADRNALEPLLRVLGFWSYVAAASGEVDLDTGLAIADELIAFLELEPFEANRLYAHVLWLSVQPATLSEARQRFLKADALPPEEIGRMVAALASLVRPPAQAEIKALERVYKTLGLENEQLHRELHNISVSVTQTNPGNAGPSASKNEPVRLDRSRIEHIQRQTATVAEMLHEIFEENDRVSAPVRSSVGNGAAQTDATIELASRLASRPRWTMDELSSLAAAVGLMAAGAIETLNDRAVALGLEPLLDCDGDVCDCYEPTLKELLSHV